ncbi:hypothetical protein [Sulfurisphaera ohwakuensis]|uniref:Uncharacterized protein n=1 Tax=Sulfurisphaera ohwakuensis TaxID=69656 RepID=A0A7J9RXY7_SULOH|nr:hypothetical protein [Sulfurisphaera ohwakuensis]MBB5254929.1 hypothetical protein [Sulfurisphaera ohwakuensis]
MEKFIEQLSASLYVIVRIRFIENVGLTESIFIAERMKEREFL